MRLMMPKLCNIYKTKKSRQHCRDFCLIYVSNVYKPNAKAARKPTKPLEPPSLDQFS
jgi:hypothetical protein